MLINFFLRKYLLRETSLSVNPVKSRVDILYKDKGCALWEFWVRAMGILVRAMGILLPIWRLSYPQVIHNYKQEGEVGKPCQLVAKGKKGRGKDGKEKMSENVSQAKKREIQTHGLCDSGCFYGSGSQCFNAFNFFIGEQQKPGGSFSENASNPQLLFNYFNIYF